MPGREQPDEVDVSYCLTADLDDRALSNAIDALSADERARRDRFVFARDRRDFAVAHALLRIRLSSHAPRPRGAWQFTTGAHGKPELDVHTAAQLSFNLSHTDGLVACAIAREGDIGIDVETIDRVADDSDVARRYFSASEAAAIERCAPDARRMRFIELWTLKEAYIKAVGEGLSRPLDSFAFEFEEDDTLRFHASGAARGESWRFALFAPSPRHRLAVAIRSSSAAASLRLSRFDDIDSPPRFMTAPALRILW